MQEEEAVVTEDHPNSDLSKEVLTNRSMILFVIFAIFHFVISILNLDNIVWVVNWESGVLVAEGVPMYEQSGTVYNSIGKPHSLPPDHFPLYFYFIALIVNLFGESQIMARVITWVFVILVPVILFYTVKPRTEQEWVIVQILYFLDPQLIVSNYYGKFDQFTMFFLLLGMYLVVVADREIVGGIVLGLGIMVKFFPIFAFLVIGAVFLNQQKFKKFTLFALSGVITAGGIFLYHYYIWRDQFLEVIIYQVNRRTVSLSLWFYILPEDISGTTLLIPQLIIMAIVGLMILLAPRKQGEYFPYVATSVLTAAFCAMTRQYYSTYAYFFAAPLIPVIIVWFRSKKYIPIIYSISCYAIFHLGTQFCHNSCYPNILPFTIYSWIGVYLVFIGTVLVIPIYFLYFKYLEE